MSSQSPLISIPKKSTTDTDWSGPIRVLIANSYGEDSRNYVEEISVLGRCRQDAVRGAGSDQTARDLIYKYFGQLELLELRFAEIKVSFTWNDSFTEKPTTQSSLAFEKASIIHLLSSVLSSLAASASRADPEGLKRAYSNSRAAAGMLTYINDNFLHAPSTDLSREVIHFCIGIMMAQATEIFTEKLIEEKKSASLIARAANQSAGMYSALVEEMKEFQGKGVFDRNWLYVLQVKAKLFASYAQYYKATADVVAGKYGHALVRMRLADTLAVEAQRQANGFTYSFVSSATPTLPSDAATALNEITKAHQSVCKEAKDQASKDNDLIYHDILPSEASLPAIEKVPPAPPITIQELYANPEISKLIGPDIFVKLVPLAVHESASVYSEEKAKLIRAEVERVDLSEGEVRASLEHLGLPGIVGAWRRVAEDEGGDDEDVEVSTSVRRLADEVQQGGSIESQLRELDSGRSRCERDLRELSGMLDNESRECERMRSKYNPQFTQTPSGPHTAHFRSNISSNLSSLQSAASSDSNISSLWEEVRGEIGVFSGGSQGLQGIARQVAAGKAPKPEDRGQSLLDLQDEFSATNGLESEEKDQLKTAASQAGEKLDRLNKIRRERDDVLKDLKEKLQNDDVSNLLLLNRRSQNVEPQLFATELEKFRPYQSRIASAIAACQSTIQELEMLVRQVEKGKGIKEKQKSAKDRNRRIREWEHNLEDVGEKYNRVRAGLGKGTGFYDSLGVIVDQLRGEVKNFVNSRESERNRMIGEIETRQRISGGSSSSPPPLPPSSSLRGIEAQLSGLSMGSGGSYGNPSRSPNYSSVSPPPTSSYPTSPPPISSYGTGLPPPPAQRPTPSYVPPPPQPPKSNPYDFSSISNVPSAFNTTPSYTSPPRQERQDSYSSNHQPTHSSSPYYAPPSRPSQPSYPAPPSQPSHSSHYTSQPPQPPSASYPTPPRPPTQPSYPSYNSSNQSPYPPPPSQPQRQSSASYYPPPPSQQYSSPPPVSPTHYSSPPPQQQQQYSAQQSQSAQYSAYTPPGGYGGYQSPQPPQPPSQQQQGYGYPQYR